MFICEECGHIFDQSEVDTWEENRGECWGVPCTEKLSGCPNCRGYYTDAKRCKKCGDWIKEDDPDLCNDCIEKEKTQENVVEIGNQWKEKVTINGFLTSCFSEEEIEDILFDHINSLDEEKKKQMIVDYCDFDTLDFINWVVKKWKREK